MATFTSGAFLHSSIHFSRIRLRYRTCSIKSKEKSRHPQKILGGDRQVVERRMAGAGYRGCTKAQGAISCYHLHWCKSGVAIPSSVELLHIYTSDTESRFGPVIGFRGINKQKGKEVHSWRWPGFILWLNLDAARQIQGTDFCSEFDQVTNAGGKPSIRDVNLSF